MKADISIKERIEQVAVSQITITDFLLFYSDQNKLIQQSIIDEVESLLKSIGDNYIKDAYSFKHWTDNSIKPHQLQSIIDNIEKNSIYDFFNSKYKASEYINDKLVDNIIPDGIVSNQSHLLKKHTGESIYFSFENINEKPYKVIVQTDVDDEFSDENDKINFQNLIPHHFIKHGSDIREIDDPLYKTKKLLDKLKSQGELINNKREVKADLSIQERIEKVAVGQITTTDFLMFYSKQSQSIQQSIIDEVRSFKKVVEDNYVNDYLNFNDSDNYVNLYQSKDISIEGVLSAHSDISNKHIGKDIYFTIEEVEEYSEAYYHLLNRDEQFQKDVENGLFQYIFHHHYIRYNSKLINIEDPSELTRKLLTKLNHYKPEKTTQSTSKEPEFVSRIMTKLDDYKPEKTTQSTYEETETKSKFVGKPRHTFDDKIKNPEIAKKLEEYLEDNKPRNRTQVAFVYVQLVFQFDLIPKKTKTKEFGQWLYDHDIIGKELKDEIDKQYLEVSKSNRGKYEYKVETDDRIENFLHYMGEVLNIKNNDSYL